MHSNLKNCFFEANASYTRGSNRTLIRNRLTDGDGTPEDAEKEKESEYYSDSEDYYQGLFFPHYH